MSAADPEADLLLAAVKASGNGVVITDMNGLILWVNPAFTVMTGYELAEVKGRSCNVLRSGRHDSAFYADLWSIIVSGNTWRGEIVNRRKDGSLYVEEMTITPITDAAGRLANCIAIKQDVTQRREAEELLRRHEERLREAQELAHMGHIRVAFDTGEVEWSEETYRIFGVDPGQEPWSFGEFQRRLHPDDRKTMRMSLANATGQPFQEELRVALDDGRMCLMHFRGRARLDRQGQIAGLAITVLDMTEQGATRERLRMLFEHSVDAHLLFTRNGIVDCNPGALAMFGVEGKDRLLGLKMVDLSPEVQPSGIPSRELGKEMVMIARERGLHRFDWAFRRLDGADLYVEITATPDRAFGEPAMLLVVHNLTERKRVEAALQQASEHRRMALEAARLGSWDYQCDAGLVHWDERSCAIFGVAPRGCLEYSEVIALIHPADRGATDEAVKRAVAGADDGAYDHEFRVVWRDGSVHWVAAHGRAFFSGGGARRQALHLVGVNMDITERKEFERQLSQTQKLESLGQLSAGIAHEINTPIQYVGDNATFLKEAFRDLLKSVQPHPDVDVKYLQLEIPNAIEQLQEGASQVARIVRAMKEFSHPGPAEKAPVDLNRAIESAIIMSKNVWKYVAEVSTDLDQTLPPVPCRLGEFNQVMLNLIVNAAHAISDVVNGSGRQGTIHISTRRDGEWVEIRVSDTGSGIPEAIRCKVFDPFFTTKPVGNGTGQGLAVAHSVIVQKHGGTIRFDSEVGRGTTFAIRIPMA